MDHRNWNDIYAYVSAQYTARYGHHLWGPNPVTTDIQFIREAAEQIHLNGRAYVWKVKNQSGCLSEVWLIPTLAVIPVPACNKYPIGCYKIDVRLLSSLRSTKSPTAVLTFDKDYVSEEDIERIKAEFDKSNRLGQWMLLPPGCKIKYVQEPEKETFITIPAEDIDVIRLPINSKELDALVSAKAITKNELRKEMDYQPGWDQLVAYTTTSGFWPKQEQIKTCAEWVEIGKPPIGLD